MDDKFQEIYIKNCTYYFFQDIINMRNLDLNKIKIDEQSYKNICNYYIGYVAVKDLRYVKLNRANSLYVIINKINGYFEESSGNKHLT